MDATQYVYIVIEHDNGEEPTIIGVFSDAAAAVEYVCNRDTLCRIQKFEVDGVE